MFNYELDTSLLPQVWIAWVTKKDGTIYMNGATGKRQNEPEPWMGYRAYQNHHDGDKVLMGFDWKDMNKEYGWVASGSKLIYSYAKYHEDIDRLEVAAVKYDTTRGEYAHKWSWAGERFFIGRDKSCLLSDGKSFSGWEYVFNGHNAYHVRNVLQILNRQKQNDNFLREFKKFIGADYFTIGNGNSVNITAPWHFTQWYETVQKERSTGKAQKLVDKLIEMPLTSIDGFAEKYPIKKAAPYSYYDMKNVVYFEKINDKWSVLRLLKRTDDNQFEETQRTYIDNKNTVRITSLSKTGWIPSRQSSNYYWNSGYSYLANKDEAMEQCPRIKYILSSAREQQDWRLINYLTTALRFPEVEQLCKLGCCGWAEDIALSSTPKATLKGIFGEYYNDKAKNLLQKIGLTKPQLDIYHTLNNNASYRYSAALAEMRKQFGDDLTYLDINSFEKYLIGCNEWRGYKCWHGGYIFEGLGIDDKKLFKNLVRLMSKNDRIFEIVRDTIYGYNRLDRERKFDVNWYFDEVSDAIRTHDAVIELARLQNAERQALYNMQAAERRKKEEEKRKKLDKERAIYEYEDYEYIIRLPKDATEIVSEGTLQHICIGSYTSRHSMGDTNLFFLRRKSEPDVPFYAIEMDNEKNIVQIHGFGNRWLGNNPEAIPTVIRWLRKNDIKCSNEILTCKATGYGKINDYVPMPTID